MRIEEWLNSLPKVFLYALILLLIEVFIVFLLCLRVDGGAGEWVAPEFRIIILSPPIFYIINYLFVIFYTKKLIALLHFLLLAPLLAIILYNGSFAILLVPYFITLLPLLTLYHLRTELDNNRIKPNANPTKSSVKRR